MRQSSYSDAVAAVERRRTVVRTVLFLIILGTLPFYLLGALLLANAPGEEDPNSGEPIVTVIPPSNTPIGSDPTEEELRPTWTPRPSNTPRRQDPTPPQFQPQPTRFLTATPVFVLPSSTPAPTLTPFPTITPLPTDTPLPPPPTFTPLPPPSDTPDVPPTRSGPIEVNPPPVFITEQPVDPGS
jgi:hypothetical protein